MGHSLKDPRHPIWAILRTAVMLLGLTALLYLNANNFDETELRVIGGYIAIALGTECGVHRICRRRESGDGG